MDVVLSSKGSDGRSLGLGHENWASLRHVDFEVPACDSQTGDQAGNRKQGTIVQRRGVAGDK